MTTKTEPAPIGQSDLAELYNLQLAAPRPTRRRTRRILLGFALAGVIAGLAFSQAPLQFMPLADGYSPEHNVNLHLKGQTDVLTADLIFQPGGTTGWHYHPGPVIVTIKSGALTEIGSNGCMTVHPANTAFFEEADVVHNVVNNTGGVTEVYATFLSPTGTQPLIPAADPGGTCRH